MKHSIFQRWIMLAGVAAAPLPTLSAQTASNPSPAPAPATEIRAGATSGQSASGHQGVSAELVRQLLDRVEQLEARERERERAQASGGTGADAALVKTLTARVAELEAALAGLKEGKVLPEISVGPETGPSTQELDQKIRVVERKNELAAEAAEARAKESPRLSVGAGGFALSSADTNYVLRIRGLVQLDSRTFLDDNPRSEGNDSFLLRRARPILEGTLARDFSYQFVPEFAGNAVQILDANLNYAYRPALQLRAGKFKGPVGFEHLQSDATLPFNERSPVSALVASRSLGVQLWGELGEGRLNYAVGVFNGAGDGRTAANADFGDDKEVAGRVGVEPFRGSGQSYLAGLGFGVGGSFSQVSSNALALPATTGGTLPGYATSGQQQFFAYNPVVGPVVAEGAHWRVSPYLTYLNGPFGFLGEYGISAQGVLNNATLRGADLEHSAWQVSAQYVLTGEPASFSGITPKRPFGLSGGGLGAWQLVGRFGRIDIDDDSFLGFSNPATSASEATTWSVGANWWLNRNLRVLTSYSFTSFKGGGGLNLADPSTFVPPATVAHQDENAFFTRLQLGF